MASSLTAFWITLIQIHTHHLCSIFDEVLDTSPDSSPKQVLNESLDTPPEHISEQVAISEVFNPLSNTYHPLSPVYLTLELLVVSHMFVLT